MFGLRAGHRTARAGAVVFNAVTPPVGRPLLWLTVSRWLNDYWPSRAVIVARTPFPQPDVLNTGCYAARAIPYCNYIYQQSAVSRTTPSPPMHTIGLGAAARARDRHRRRSRRPVAAPLARGAEQKGPRTRRPSADQCAIQTAQPDTGSKQPALPGAGPRGGEGVIQVHADPRTVLGVRVASRRSKLAACAKQPVGLRG